MNKADIPFHSATELGQLIAKGEVSAVETVEAHLERIEAVNDALNSYITVCRDDALDAARRVDEEIARGEHRGPLHGVPFAVKDQFLSKGVLSTGGSAILKDFVPDYDSTAVARLKEAGAILLGKLNMSEFATGNSFHHPGGTPRNPWDPERNPGTSSGGSGAATAAFLTGTSLGEDTGGSVRNPANNCGVVGLRPTWGLVSRYGLMGASWSMDTGGPITRTVEDCAITLQAIAGHDPNDPYTARVDVPDYRSGLTGDLRGVRIGLVTGAVDADFLNPQVKHFVGKAITDLGELGASLEEVSIPLMNGAAAVTRVLLAVESASLYTDLVHNRLSEWDYNVQLDFLVGALLPAQVYHKAQKVRELVRAQVSEAFKKVDVLALPTSSEPAPPVMKEAGLKSKEEAASRMSGRRSLTGIANLANVPALSVPCGFASVDGTDLPVGLQLMGRAHEDGLLLRVAHAYEQSTSWHMRRPPI